MFVWNVTSFRLLSSFTESSYWTFPLVFHQPLSNWFINKYLRHAMPWAKVNGNRILLKNSHDSSTSFDFSIDTSQEVSIAYENREEDWQGRDANRLKKFLSRLLWKISLRWQKLFIWKRWRLGICKFDLINSILRGRFVGEATRNIL